MHLPQGIVDLVGIPCPNPEKENELGHSWEHIGGNSSCKHSKVISQTKVDALVELVGAMTCATAILKAKR